jgi:hypothetical protein
MAETTAETTEATTEATPSTVVKVEQGDEINGAATTTEQQQTIPAVPEVTSTVAEAAELVNEDPMETDEPAPQEQPQTEQQQTEPVVDKMEE